MLVYDFRSIEAKWQLHWDEQQTFKTDIDYNKKKFYCLDMFPYPSAQGLHVGHLEGYSASDIINRFFRMQGFNVLHPFGWDSFGLPTERYAAQTGQHPAYVTYQNIANFKKQIKSLGKGIDWSRELATSDSYYYKWTQWIFKKLYQNQLAVLQDVEVNFCPNLGTVLANEEVISTPEGIISERGGHPVFKRKMKQWVLKITKYADRLLNDLSLLDWPTSIKEMQIKWIGKTSGFIFYFPLLMNNAQYLSVFTTMPQMIFGVSALILAPEHPLVSLLTTAENQSNVNDYLSKTQRKSNLERDINREITGAFTGSYAINPCNKQKIPIWISDYVFMHFGTGALMSVPLYNQKDFVFATKYNLNKYIIKYCSSCCHLYSEIKLIKKPCLQTSGTFINSDFLNGLDENLAKEKIMDLSIKNKWGEPFNTYKIHDWLYSRQIYWGEPFPVYYDENNKIYLMSDHELPLELPETDKIEYLYKSESPLSQIDSWLYFCKNGKNYKRDSNTMPQFAGSSWYYIGYILKNYLSMIPINTMEAKKLLDYFLPVDIYIGGAEHAHGHLIYARFWCKCLYDWGLISTPEPFYKLINQGMILGNDNLKMSKSRGNIVNASEVLDTYGADVIRLYIMFLGPLEENKSWSGQGLKGIQRFLNRIYNIFDKFTICEQAFTSLNKITHQTIRNVTEYYNKFQFNKVISQLMIMTNHIYQYEKVDRFQIRILLQLLNPIAPHITEELNQIKLNSKEELVYSSWPKYNISILEEKETTIIIQINGKMKSQLSIPFDTDKSEILKIVEKDEKILRFIKNKKIINTIYVKNKLLNIVLI
ncbi:MAG: leucine--tRNA ligase [Candidatus Phytoplasma australasiaticum]|nr:leucine--tRNA ligase [Candidatus Phytoplasma australasiaticum]